VAGLSLALLAAHAAAEEALLAVRGLVAIIGLSMVVIAMWQNPILLLHPLAIIAVVGLGIWLIALAVFFVRRWMGA
jgi:hypothetical protein